MAAKNAATVPRLLGPLLAALAAGVPLGAAGLRLPLRLHERHEGGRQDGGRKGASFVEVEAHAETAARLLRNFRARHNNTHAIEYYGEVSVGGQNLSVLFDTGSDSLLVPAAECISEACASHRSYNPDSSTTAGGETSVAPRQVEFGTGRATGMEEEDVVCLAEGCARVQFLEMLEESDDPFKHAGFDGVLGLSLQLRRAATNRTSVLQSLVDSHAIPSPIFAVFLAKDWHRDPSEISFGSYSEDYMAGPLHWVSLSEPAYWQFSISAIRVAGKALQLCHDSKANSGGGASSLPVGSNISTFFGRMCCRSLDEFEHETRCQYHSNYTETGNRSRYTDHGQVLAEYADGRVGVQMADGCVQKLPREWLSLPNGCRGDGTLQAMLDTGSSLMMGPDAIVAQILAAIGVKENCTEQLAAADTGKNMSAVFPSISFALPDGAELTLAPEDYMDQLVLVDGVYCWPHLLPMPETAKGALLVLGMPFLRAYYSVFDAGQRRVGFAAARQPSLKSSGHAPQGARAERRRQIHLRARRPEGA